MGRGGYQDTERRDRKMLTRTNRRRHKTTEEDMARTGRQTDGHGREDDKRQEDSKNK